MGRSSRSTSRGTPIGRGVIEFMRTDDANHILGLRLNSWVSILVFLLGCAMGVGKAAVFKHIPEYFPDNVGSVGGLVGMLGGLGGGGMPGGGKIQLP